MTSLELDQAAKLLLASDRILVSGLEVLDMDSQYAAWQLADRLRATIDSSLENPSNGKPFALQSIGKVTATFGEIANRCDTLIFWFSDPVAKAAQEFAFLQSFGKKADVVVVGDAQNATSAIAETWIQVDSERACDVLAIMQQTLHQKRALPAVASIFPEIAQAATQLASLVARSDCVAVFLPDNSIGGDSEFDLLTEMLFQWIRDLNMQKPAFVSSFSHQNLVGAEYCLASATGFGRSIDLSRGYPRYGRNEFSTRTLLEARSVDTLVLFTNGESDLSFETQGLLNVIDVIEIGSGVWPDASVLLNALPSGKDRVFQRLRADGVMSSTDVTSSNIDTTEDVIRRLTELVSESEATKSKAN